MPVFLQRTSKGDDLPPDWLIDAFEPRLDAIEAELGLKLKRKGSKVATPLACGAYGCVFAIEGDDRRVLKVTEDEFEGHYSSYIRLLQQNGAMTNFGSVRAVTVRIDGVWLLEENTKRKISVILEERVDPKGKVPAALGKAADLYTDGWNRIVMAQKSKASKAKKAEEYTKGEEEIERGLQKMDEQGTEGRQIAEFLRLIYDEGAPLTDMHSKNLCVRAFDGGPEEKAGQIVVIDFGVSAAHSPFRRKMSDFEFQNGSRS